MATYAQLSQDFWTDNYILDIEPEAKLLFVYLLTNSHRNTTGIYEIHLRTIAYETGLDLAPIKQYLSDFADAGKVYYEEGHIVLPNRPLHTSFNNDNVRAFVVKHVNGLPSLIADNHPDLINALLKLATDNVKTGVDQPLDQPLTQGGVLGYIKNKEKKRKENNITPHIPPTGGHAPASVQKKQTQEDLSNCSDECKNLIAVIDNLVTMATEEELGLKPNRRRRLKPEQLQKIIDKHGENDTKKMLKVFYTWKFNTGKEVKNDYSSLLNAIARGWVFENGQAQQTKQAVKVADGGMPGQPLAIDRQKKAEQEKNERAECDRLDETPWNDHATWGALCAHILKYPDYIRKNRYLATMPDELQKHYPKMTAMKRILGAPDPVGDALYGKYREMREAE